MQLIKRRFDGSLHHCHLLLRFLFHFFEKKVPFKGWKTNYEWDSNWNLREEKKEVKEAKKKKKKGPTFCIAYQLVLHLPSLAGHSRFQSEAVLHKLEFNLSSRALSSNGNLHIWFDYTFVITRIRFRQNSPIVALR